MRPGLMTCSVRRRSGGLREYLAGLLAPRDRNKTLTALVGAEPVTGAQHPAVQRLQFFLPEVRWVHERVNARRLELQVLTERERAVATQVSCGRSNADIAGRLCMCEATVKAHLSRVLAKLNAADRMQVAITVRDAGLD
jgi:DNA-binding NarL/FixJ family response regulator